MKITKTTTTVKCDVCRAECDPNDSTINETIGWVGQGNYAITIHGKLYVKIPYQCEAGPDLCKKCVIEALEMHLNKLRGIK
jgi:hypothetical protein